MSRKGRRGRWHPPRQKQQEAPERQEAEPEEDNDYAGRFYEVEWSAEFARDDDDPDRYSKRSPPFSRGKLDALAGDFVVFTGTDQDHDEIWVRSEDIWSMRRIQ